MRGIEALNKLKQNNENGTHLFDYELHDVIEKELKALEIIKKYIKVTYQEDELFLYGFEDKQYVSLRSSNLMSKEEYELLKEVLK